MERKELIIPKKPVKRTNRGTSTHKTEFDDHEKKNPQEKIHTNKLIPTVRYKDSVQPQCDALHYISQNSNNSF